LEKIAKLNVSIILFGVESEKKIQY
jgi:hypothetical protein